MFRDGKCPYKDEDAAMFKSIATVFAIALASMVRKDAGEEDETSAPEGAPEHDDVSDTPWKDDEPKQKPKNKKAKDQHDADWWKRGEPPPF